MAGPPRTPRRHWRSPSQSNRRWLGGSLRPRPSASARPLGPPLTSRLRPLGVRMRIASPPPTSKMVTCKVPSGADSTSRQVATVRTLNAQSGSQGRAGDIAARGRAGRLCSPASATPGIAVRQVVPPCSSASATATSQTVWHSTAVARHPQSAQVQYPSRHTCQPFDCPDGKGQERPGQKGEPLA